MQIKITVPRGADPTIHVASLLGDLWDDYVFYRKQAESVAREQKPLQYKRYVRSAIHSYFGYFEGVLNTWIHKCDPKFDLERTSFGQKLAIIRKHVVDVTRIPFLEIKRARQIRNLIVHVKPTDKDVEIMETLLDGQFFRDADDFTKWLDLASDALRMKRHADVARVLQDFRQRIGS